MGRPHIPTLLPDHPSVQFTASRANVCKSSTIWNGPLTNPTAFFRAEALFNAVKKQYGLHSFLLPLQLPVPPPPPVPVPALPPRLPVLSSHDSPSLAPQDGSSLMPGLTPPRPPASPMPRQPGPPPLTNKPAENSQPPRGYEGSTVNLTQEDIQQLGRFVREFVTMSLIPWMEKCVMEWNESVRP